MGLRDCVSVIFIQMDSFEFFLKHAKNLFAHLSKLLYSAWICNGKKCCYKVIMSIFKHFNVYEDILNNFFCLRSKKIISGDKCSCNIMELGTF